MIQTGIHSASGKQNYWAIVCPDSRVKGGLWNKWLIENCVAIGWSPDRFRMHGSTKESGWRLARKRVQEIVPGDIIVPYLRNNTFGVPSEVVRVAASDGEWLPTVSAGKDADYPGQWTLGRRIEVKWLEKGAPPFNKVAVVPRTMRWRGGVIRHAIERLNPKRFTRIMRIIRNPANWKTYESAEENIGHAPASQQFQVPVKLIEEAISREVENKIERAAGFESNPKIKRAVELHAMHLVMTTFQKMGFEVKDHSAKQPYDLFCERDTQARYVEVKGTRTTGLSIILTAGEVNFIEKNKPNCTLCVVHGITIDGDTNPKASGGKIRMLECAGLDVGDLRPISFMFEVPDHDES